jgi:hypothetical protein
MTKENIPNTIDPKNPRPDYSHVETAAPARPGAECRKTSPEESRAFDEYLQKQSQNPKETKTH